VAKILEPLGVASIKVLVLFVSLTVRPKYLVLCMKEGDSAGSPEGSGESKRS
jgi:hypothetical protein